MHAKASIDGNTIAETDNYEVVEGNIYFPPASIKDHEDVYSKTNLTTGCPWKGEANYYTLSVGGKKLENAAWYYPAPFAKAQNIKDYVAFSKGKVNIESS